MGTIRQRGCFLGLPLVFVILHIVKIDCSNLEIRLPIVKEGPLDSLFGLSVAEHTVMKTRPVPTNGFEGSMVLVGAPTYEASDAVVPKTGAVFRCPLTTFVDDCEDLKLDSEENDPGENKTDQWLGVTVRSQGTGGKVGVCAHRYKKVSTEEISGLGKCFLRNPDLTQDTIRPSALKVCINIGLGKSKYGYCQAGTGFYISEEEYGGKGYYISGTPGAGDWRGGVFTDNVPDLDNLYVEKSRTNLVDQSTGVGLNSYLGFSVTSGKFGPEFLVASGAPRYDAIGAVVMLAKQGSGSLMMQSIIKGEQLTESFGYEVCSADLDGDGFDDLLVGAPIYFDRTTEAGGRVYIYLNKDNNGSFADVEPIRLTGPRDSMFGIAMTNLGDLNLDGYEDVAIGAPYENNGEGAVYIYLGSPNGVVQPASQKITPSDLPDDLPTTRDISGAFGYALSGGIDLDGNQYPDLSVGSFESNSVVTFRARPIVNITAELLLEHSEIDANATNYMYKGKPTFRFYVQARMKYVCNADEFDAPIRVRYSIEAEEERRNINRASRIIFEQSDSYIIRDETMSLRPQSEETPKRSPKFYAVLRPGFTDIFRKIPFKLTYKLRMVDVETPAPGDDLPDINELPILNSLHDPSYVAELDFRKACAQDDGKCITDLDLYAALVLNGQPPVLRVGEQQNLFVRVELKNKEEPAYDAKLTITFPETLTFNKIEDDASQVVRYGCKLLENNVTVIQCDLGNPFPERHVEMFTLKFDASEVPLDAGNITISMVATATNEDRNPDDNQVDLFAEVESVIDIEVLGETNSPEYTFGGIVRGESAMQFTDEIGEEVIHTWTVYNKKRVALPESVLTISFPYEVANGKWLLYMTHDPEVKGGKGYCKIDPIYVNELKIKERPGEPGSDFVSTATPAIAAVNPTSTVQSMDAPATSTGGRRKRRAVDDGQEEITRPQRSSNGQTQALKGQILRLDCWNGLATCFQFQCFIDQLKEGEEAEVVIRSRLWNATFLEDYINVQQVNVSSVGRIKIVNAPFLTQDNVENDEFNLTMIVKPNIETLPPPEPLAWWIILLAVLGGLIILILLILLLWKCGFFERKSMAYKYATVTQKTAEGKAGIEKTAYYDEKYFT